MVNPLNPSFKFLYQKTTNDWDVNFSSLIKSKKKWKIKLTTKGNRSKTKWLITVKKKLQTPIPYKNRKKKLNKNVKKKVFVFLVIKNSHRQIKMI